MQNQRSDHDWGELYSRHIEEWQRRFAEACVARRVDGCVIFSGAVKHRVRDDIEVPFFAEPYFKAWVPNRYPDSALKIVPGEKPQLIYLQMTDFWHMDVPEPEGFWTDAVDVCRVTSRADLLKQLGTVTRLAAIGDDASESMGFSSVNDSALFLHLDYYRAIKTPYEVACIEEANRIAAAGHAAAHRALADRPSEFDLNRIYCEATVQRESELPYPNIVCLNEHAGILHYQYLDRDPPDEFRSFLLDAGADCHGYASDVTRTQPGDSKHFAALIESMDAMQRRLCAGMRDDVSFVTLHERAHRLLAEVLVEHGIVRCTHEEAYRRGITRSFLPHGLGHLLGLQVHDAGGHLHEPQGPTGAAPVEHPFLRLTRTLQPGFVVTVEPGLYFIPALLEGLRNSSMNRLINWDCVAEFLPHGGIRIEDNVLVTEAESRNLTRPALSRL